MVRPIRGGSRLYTRLSVRNRRTNRVERLMKRNEMLGWFKLCLTISALVALLLLDVHSGIPDYGE